MPNSATSPDREERFLALFLPCQGEVRAFVRSVVWDRAKADDVFQDVALVLWREFDRYDPARPFGAWARGVAAKTIVKHVTKDRRAPTALSAAAVEALVDAFAAFDGSSSAEEDALHACVERLPDKSRTLVQLRYRQALKLSEIADRVRSTPDAVHKALARIRVALQACVERHLQAARRMA